MTGKQAGICRSASIIQPKEVEEEEEVGNKEISQGTAQPETPTGRVGSGRLSSGLARAAVLTVGATHLLCAGGLLAGLARDGADGLFDGAGDLVAQVRLALVVRGGRALLGDAARGRGAPALGRRRRLLAHRRRRRRVALALGRRGDAGVDAGLRVARGRARGGHCRPSLFSFSLPVLGRVQLRLFLGVARGMRVRLKSRRGGEWDGGGGGAVATERTRWDGMGWDELGGCKTQSKLMCHSIETQEGLGAEEETYVYSTARPRWLTGQFCF